MITRLQADLDALADSPLAAWEPWLRQAIGRRMDEYTHGLLQDWLNSLDDLSVPPVARVDLKDSVSVDFASPLSADDLQRLRDLLMRLHPWRKGPYRLGQLVLDTEWRSDWKWERIRPHIDSLEQRRVLDVGCGNGYHLWRMLGEGASWAIGVDPSQLFWSQFQAIRQFVGNDRAMLLPIGFEHLPLHLNRSGFDTVFCMGVLYHRKNPLQLLETLKACIRPGGQLVLETLVIEGDVRQILYPTDRYARMRNVWALPSVPLLQLWLERIGYTSVRVVDINRTTTEEQRRTDWMTFESLEQALDPTCPSRTIEGYPAPLRATLVANVA